MFLVCWGLGKGWAMPARLLKAEWPVTPFPHVHGPKSGPQTPATRASPERKQEEPCQEALLTEGVASSP